VKLLIQAHRDDEAVARLRDVVTRFDTPADACLDAASAFHVRGSLDDAYRWYREGLQTVRQDRGRMPYEFLEGILFIHAERGEWSAATDALRAYEAAKIETNMATDSYGDWIEWRRTGHFIRRLRSDQSVIDLYRYIALEAEAELAPDNDEATLKRIDTANFSGVYPALAKSVKAVILERRGDHAAAQRWMRESFDAVRRVRTDPAARAHFDLVAARYARIVGER